MPVSAHPTGVSRTAPHAAPHSLPAVRPAQPGAPHVRLEAGPRDRVAPVGTSAPAATRRASGRTSPGGGFNPGWLAACIGLVAAACALGRPDGTRAMATRGRDAFASILKPLGGRG